MYIGKNNSPSLFELMKLLAHGLYHTEIQMMIMAQCNHVYSIHSVEAVTLPGGFPMTVHDLCVWPVEGAMCQIMK